LGDPSVRLRRCESAVRHEVFRLDGGRGVPQNHPLMGSGSPSECDPKQPQRSLRIAAAFVRFRPLQRVRSRARCPGVPARTFRLRRFDALGVYHACGLRRDFSRHPLVGFALRSFSLSHWPQIAFASGARAVLSEPCGPHRPVPACRSPRTRICGKSADGTSPVRLSGFAPSESPTIARGLLGRAPSAAPLGFASPRISPSPPRACLHRPAARGLASPVLSRRWLSLNGHTNGNRSIRFCRNYEGIGCGC